MAEESLGTLLNFINQGSQPSGVNIPQLGGEDAQAPQLPNQGMPQQSGGSLGGLLHSIAGNYLQHKIAKYQNNQDAKELGDAYTPIVEAQAETATDPNEKETYGTFAKMIKSGNPALQAIGLAGHKKFEESKAALTTEQRNWRDKELRPYIEQEYANKGQPTSVREMAIAYPQLKPGDPAYAQQLIALKRSGGIQMGNDLPPPPQGYMWAKDGSRQVPIPGGPADQTTKPLTEFQGKASSFSKRMQEANTTLLENEDLISVPQLSQKQWAEALPVIGPAAGAVLNQHLSATQQRVDRAQRGFVNALLRHDSGATINPDEFDNYKKEFFPAIGDDALAIEDKRKAREEAIKNMDIEAGAGGNAYIKKVPNTGGQLPATKSSKAVQIPAKQVDPLAGWTLEQLEAEAKRRGIE